VKGTHDFSLILRGTHSLTLSFSHLAQLSPHFHPHPQPYGGGTPHPSVVTVPPPIQTGAKNDFSYNTYNNKNCEKRW